MHVVDCCMYAGISGRNSFKGGENCETREKRIIIIFFFLKKSESVILVGTVQTKP